MSDFYEEILGISTKEMTMSENVSIPDINKRRLCNIEILTNKRCQSDIQTFGERRLDTHFPQTEESMSNFHSEKSRGLGSAKIFKPSKYDFSMQNKVSTDALHKNNKDIWLRVDTTDKRTISNNKIISNLTETLNEVNNRQTPKSQLAYDNSSRGSYNINKSSEFPSKLYVLSAERNGRNHQNSYAKTRVENGDASHTIKIMNPLSNKASVNNLLRGTRAETITSQERRPYGQTKGYGEQELNRAARGFVNYLDGSEGSSGRVDSPNKPKDTRNYNRPYKIPNSYANSNRYRSISFQSKLEAESSAGSPQMSRGMTVKGTGLYERKSLHYRNVHPETQQDTSINFEERVKARQAMRSREFERVYQESTEGALKTPPMGNLGGKACLKLDLRQNTTRRSLADQIKQHSANNHRTRHINLDVLNSERSVEVDFNQHPRSSVLMEKDIPDEGNARRPDGHKTKMNNFQGTGRKVKHVMRDYAYAKGSGKKLYMNNSYENMQKHDFKDTESINYKQKMLESKENRQVKTKRNLDENIEPDKQESKFLNIQSSENFCPGRVKRSEPVEPEPKWSFWKTLKNPLQWFGLSKDNPVNTPNKDTARENISDNDSGRNRSISYHVTDAHRERFANPKSNHTNRTLKYAKSIEKKKYPSFAKMFRDTLNPPSDKYTESRSLRYSRKS